MVTVVTVRAKHGPRQPRPLLKLVLGSGRDGTWEYCTDMLHGNLYRWLRAFSAPAMAMALVAALIGAPLSVACAVSQDWTAPDSEIQRARSYLASRMGQAAVDSSVVLVSGVLTNSSDDGRGCAVLFRFSPPSLPGAECDILVLALEGGLFHSVAGQDVPDCLNTPGLCALSIAEDVAVAIAIGAGLASTSGEYLTKLGIFEGFSGFAWRIAPSQSPGATRCLLINAVTGNVERDYVEHSCG